MVLSADTLRQQVENFVAMARGENITNRAGSPDAPDGPPSDTQPVSGTSGSFARDLLNSLGYEPTAENVRVVDAWVQAEGTKAAWNPLATTMPAAGATNFNHVGVKNYTSYESGLDATVRTLRNGRYQAILDALAAGNSAVAVAQAIANSPWGTGDLVLKILGGN